MALGKNLYGLSLFVYALQYLTGKLKNKIKYSIFNYPSRANSNKQLQKFGTRYTQKRYAGFSSSSLCK